MNMNNSIIEQLFEMQFSLLYNFEMNITCNSAPPIILPQFAYIHLKLGCNSLVNFKFLYIYHLSILQVILYLIFSIV